MWGIPWPYFIIESSCFIEHIVRFIYKKKSIYNNPAFRYIFEIIVLFFSVTLSFYIQSRLNETEKSMARQTKRGHVYVVSKIGSFGEDIYKIGIIRRLDPMIIV